MRFLFAVAATAAACASATALAQVDSYPNKPVRVVIPFSAGTPIELPARAVTQRMMETFGQSFVFESANIPANPRGTGQFYDGGDRLFTAGRATTVTKAGWGENPGSVAAWSLLIGGLWGFITREASNAA